MSEINRREREDRGDSFVCSPRSRRAPRLYSK